MKQVKVYGWAILLVPVFTLLIAVISSSGARMDPSDVGEFIGFIVGFVSIPVVLVFLPFLLYNLYCCREVVKNYPKYTAHTVVLDKPHTSFLYKNAVYFTVSITGHGYVDTSPIFSDALFSAFTLDEYAGIKIRALYDGKKQKVYLIDKA